MRSLSIALVLQLVILSGCGHYSTSGRTAGDIKRIAVPYLENETAEPEIEIEITQRIIEGLVKDNTLKVTGEEDADAVLEGSIVEYGNVPFTFSNELQADQYRLLVGLRVSLLDKKQNTYIWQDKIIKKHANYYLETTTEQTYEKALEDIYRDIVEEILGATVQEW
ncbi:MAG TPA: hypothetical protein ENO08_03270 [Candidatus Eisenbacteria bacterium]|uniref:LptE family protein n=1 Tax=Eiseniibacteriota bacterium TaxID=2212470 RepID=A0A7V2F3J5_UNCEI|nr:hypothetical protein [Candidatus Eisenbacteria bacterium]